MDHHIKDTGFQRHLHACNNAVLPGSRLPFLVHRQAVGWVTSRIAAELVDLPGLLQSSDRVTLTNPAALPGIARTLSQRGLFRWRGEAFDVRETPEAPALTQIDRGAVPSFGVRAAGVHVNGLVRRADGLHMWIARRASDKLLDPGKLDHIVAGGIPAGLGPAATLIKEAGEEAAIPPALAATAVSVGTIGYAMERPEGLRRDCLYCYDLTLPEDFTPHAADGEVEAFELWPASRVVEAVRDTGDFKFNVNLVLIDLFVREGLIGAAEGDGLDRRGR